MDYQVSARKYRPGTFDDVIGQPHVVQTLMNAIASKRVAQAYLFSGTRGVGKTTVARILAKALNCERGPTGSPCAVCVNCIEIAQGNSVDVIEIDGASNTSVDDVREIRENVKFAPFRGQYRIYIIDEVHMLSNSAFNALLKTLEEPPGHVVFIFATTEIHKIPATILSRCQHYNFRRIARTEIVERLRHVAAQDDIAIEDRSLTALARASEGSMRDALSLLDQAMAFGGKTVVHTDLELLLGAVPQELVRAMIQALIAQDSAAALHVLSALLDRGHDLRAYCAEVVEYLRNMLVVSVTAPDEWSRLIEASSEDLAQFASDKGSFNPDELQQLFAIFTQAEDSLRASAHPRFVLETASVKATRLLRKETASSTHPARPLAPERSSSGPAATRTERRPGGEARMAPVTTPIPPAPVAPKSVSAQEPSPLNAAKPERETAPSPKTKAEAARSAEGTPAGPSPGGEVAVLKWEQFQDEVGQAFPNVAPFLERGRLVGIEGHVITIGFDKQAGVARAMLEKPDNMQALTALCARLSGQPMRLRIVEQTEDDPAGPTMAQIRAAKEQEQRLVLFEQARAHPVVKRALEIFGAELTDVRSVTRQKEVQE
ncbi:DNA polymerase III, gamma and tau subunits [Nitrospira japonica]|uniref:DNA polymerase III subunit gamma/tau n=1 Tax=Nitrospira japonica TaxID=1325564 RepID=A0A1W1I3F8_9BACT|nr:DNA polymerase III subunit gamma/tau [Nitrospira japonica]SLM47515.1 DNA polymerase III, gamma and tau subunits [Nitrospira japonica]